MLFGFNKQMNIFGPHVYLNINLKFTGIKKCQILLLNQIWNIETILGKCASIEFFLLQKGKLIFVAVNVLA